MAYEKQTWVCGETITADKLNHMEDGIAQASGGGTDVGYECTETRTVLTEESVTTVAGEYGNDGSLAYSTPITAETIRVTFNGVEYVCDAVAMGGTVRGYGGISQSDTDFSEYPFAITSNSNPDASFVNGLYTETAGTYQVKIETVEQSVETSECFENAVNKVVGGGGAESLIVKAARFYKSTNTATVVFDKTLSEVSEALSNGVPCYLGNIVNTSNLCDAESLDDVIIPSMVPIMLASMNTVFIDRQFDNMLSADAFTGDLVISVTCGGIS